MGVFSLSFSYFGVSYTLYTFLVEVVGFLFSSKVLLKIAASLYSALSTSWLHILLISLGATLLCNSIFYSILATSLQVRAVYSPCTAALAASINSLSLPFSDWKAFSSLRLRQSRSKSSRIPSNSLTISSSFLLKGSICSCHSSSSEE